MPSKKYITVGTRVSESEFDELSKIANAENISISAIMKLCIQAVNNGEIVIEKGELKTCVDTHNHAVSEDSDELYRYKELGFDQVKECFEKHRYPDHEIRRQTGMMVDQISNYGNYNPRRASEEWA